MDLLKAQIRRRKGWILISPGACGEQCDFWFCGSRFGRHISRVAEYLNHLPRQNLYDMNTRIITMTGIGLCSLFIATIATLGQTVIVPASQRTIITQVPAPPTVNSFVRALDNDRYQLIQKRDNKEVYRDTQTGEKWILEFHHQNG